MNIVKKCFVLMAIVALTSIFSSCLDSSDGTDPNAQLKAETTAIDSYLTAHGLTAIKDPSGVRMVIQELGTGLPAKSIDTKINIDYVGKLFSSGVVFDQGTNKEFVLSTLIKGWWISFTTLPAGSKATLYIPSGWAYGSNGQSAIPPNATLVFDVVFNKAIVTPAELTKLGADTVAIDNYLAGKPIPIQAEKDTTGIRYVITEPGTGATATWYSKLTVKFTYKSITDDTKTLVSVDQVPSEYFYSRPVDYVNGLKVGLQKLGKGGKAKFYIPSGLGVGTQGATDSNGMIIIPPNTNLIVEVEVSDITP